jgi:DNA-binding YbaB/EbfC family protein
MRFVILERWAQPANLPRRNGFGGQWPRCEDVEGNGRIGFPGRRSTVINNIGSLADLMRNAGKLQETLQKATEGLGQIQVEASAGGDAVRARANGRLEVIAVRIDPKIVADGDVELLEDLVTAAVNQALIKAREAAARSLTSAAGGLPLPAIPGMFGPVPGPGTGSGGGG